MPEIGELKPGREVGRKNRATFIYHACVDCGKERWVLRVKGKPQSIRCATCGYKKKGIEFRGEKSSRWKGGRKKASGGYMAILLTPDDFFYLMADKRGYVKEHRLVMARSLGRNLELWEIVHHKNGIRDDNRLENLELAMLGTHTQNHNKGYRDGFQKGYYDGRDKRIRELENEIVKLKGGILCKS